jgi:hypothetical protein
MHDKIGKERVLFLENPEDGSNKLLRNFGDY